MARSIFKSSNSHATVSSWVLLTVLVSSIATSCWAVSLLDESNNNKGKTILSDENVEISNLKNQEQCEKISLRLDFLEEVVLKTNQRKNEPEIEPITKNERTVWSTEKQQLKRISRSTESTVPPSDSNNSGSSWSKLQISPHELGSMPYDHYGVSIYGHSNNAQISNITNKQFFYAPISQLNHTSARALSNKVTGKAELKFLINMWNAHVEEEVRKYTEKLVGHPVGSHQVRVLPLEKVLLSSRIPSTTYQLTNTWFDYHRHRYLSFTIICQSLDKCKELEEEMKSNPENFDHFRLQFSLASQTSERADTTIRIENIVEGHLVSKLIQRYPDAKEVLLTAQDEKRLLTESTSNIIIESFDDSVILNLNSEKKIYDILKDLLFTSRVTISNQSSHMWESVFWNDDNYRPDKTSRTWNEMYNKLDRETQNILSISFSEDKSQGVGGGIIDLIGLGWKEETSRAANRRTEEIEKLFQESKDTVQWDGEKFHPKPLSLSRFNMAALRDTHSFKERKMRISYTTAMLSINVNVPFFLREGDNSILFELKNETQSCKELKEEQSNLIKEIKEMTSSLEIMKSVTLPYAVKTIMLGLSNLQGECNLNHTGPLGFLHSPNFPQNYLDNLKCNYYIDVGSSSRVQLHFLAFSTENCCDHVEVYNGWEVDTTRILLKTSGSNIPGPVTSLTHKMLVRFTTDGSGLNKGFKAMYVKIA